MHWGLQQAVVDPLRPHVSLQEFIGGMLISKGVSEPHSYSGFEFLVCCVLKRHILQVCFKNNVLVPCFLPNSLVFWEGAVLRDYRSRLPSDHSFLRIHTPLTGGQIKPIIRVKKITSQLNELNFPPCEKSAAGLQMLWQINNLLK